MDPDAEIQTTGFDRGRPRHGARKSLREIDELEGEAHGADFVVPGVGLDVDALFVGGGAEGDLVDGLLNRESGVLEVEVSGALR